MTRDVVFGLSVLSLALLACGTPNRNNPPPSEASGSDIVMIAKKDMGYKAFDMPRTFANLSRRHGCAVKEQADGAVSVCNEGIIALVRDGTTVSVGCKTLSREQCNNLFSAIIAEGN